MFSTLFDGLLTLHYKKVYDAEDEIKREKAAEEAAIEAEKEARRLQNAVPPIPMVLPTPIPAAGR